MKLWIILVIILVIVGFMFGIFYMSYNAGDTVQCEDNLNTVCIYSNMLTDIINNQTEATNKITNSDAPYLKKIDCGSF